MRKNSLIQMLFESEPYTGADRREEDQLGPSIFELPRDRGTSYEQNKLIKITQFDHSRLVNDSLLCKTSSGAFASTTPQKNFTLKKFHEFKAAPTHKLAIVQVKRKSSKFQKRSSKEGAPQQIHQSIKKFMVTSKWMGQQSLPGLAHINTCPKNSPLSLPYRKTSFLQTHKALPAFDPQSTPLLSDTKTKSPSQSCNPKASHSIESVSRNLSTTAVKTDEIHGNRSWTSSKQSSPRLLFERRKRQESIQRNKQEQLTMRKQLKKNYGKPFVSPQGVSAMSYIVFESETCPRKLDRTFRVLQELVEAKKVYAHSHQVMVSLNSRTAVEVASLTKIMTCLVILDLVKEKPLLLEDTLKIGLFQTNIGGTSADLRRGDVYNVWQLLYGLMLPSGNDASLALAVWGGRLLLAADANGKTFADTHVDFEGESIRDTSKQMMMNPKIELKHKKRQCYLRFVQQMNIKAKELGMQKTRYTNSHGLADPNNKSCAYDLALLCDRAMSNPLFREIVKAKDFQTEVMIDFSDLNEGKIDQQNPLSFLKVGNKVIKGNLSSELSVNLINIKGCVTNESDVNRCSLKQEYRTVCWENTHQLVQQKPNLYAGIKTGATPTAGPCLASCIMAKTRIFIIIVLGCKSMKHRFKDTEALRKWLFARHAIQVAEAGEVLEN